MVVGFHVWTKNSKLSAGFRTVEAFCCMGHWMSLLWAGKLNSAQNLAGEQGWQVAEADPFVEPETVIDEKRAEVQ